MEAMFTSICALIGQFSSTKMAECKRILPKSHFRNKQDFRCDVDSEGFDLLRSLSRFNSKFKASGGTRRLQTAPERSLDMDFRKLIGLAAQTQRLNDFSVSILWGDWNKHAWNCEKAVKLFRD